MKKKLCVLTLIATVALTGCTQVPDLSNVDNNLAAQYVADALLKYDKNYDDSLDYDHSILQATPTPAPTPVPTPVSSDSAEEATAEPGSVSDNDGATAGEVFESVSVTGIYNVPGVEIKTGAYRVVSSYGSDYAVCTAKKGNKLVVVNFSVSNTTKKAKKVNLLKKNVQAELLSGDKSLGSPLLSIVEGDLQYFNTKIDANKKKQGVLIFEVAKSVKLSDVKIRFVKDGKEAVVSVH